MASFESEAKFENPLSAEEGGDDVEAGATKPKQLKHFTSDDIGLRTVDSDGGERSLGVALEIFRAYDEDEGGTLDKTEFGGVLLSLGRAGDDKAIEQVFAQMAGVHRVAQLDEMNETIFVDWFLNYSDAQPESAGHNDGIEKSKQLGKKILKPADKLKSKVLGDQARGKSQEITPESWFLIDPDSRAEDPKRKAAVVEEIHKRFETELLHLEEMVLGRDDNQHWEDVWNKKAAEHFDEEETAKALNLPHTSLQAIKIALMDQDMPEAMAEACFRVFLRRRAKAHVEKKTDLSAAMKGASSAMTLSSPKKSNLPKDPLAAAAVRWVSSDEMYRDLVEDSIPLETAIEAVKEALEREVLFRKAKIKELTEKAEKLSDDMPLEVKVEGLRGASSVANGTYLAAGLRQYWGRPVYVQHLDEHDHTASTHNVFFYDQEYGGTEIIHGRQVQSWNDGVWVLAPTLNSARCTAWVFEAPDSPLYYPPLTDDTQDFRDGLGGVAWNVFDPAHGEWKLAPGSHCPSFCVTNPQEHESIKGYYEQAIEDQKAILADIEQKLGSDASIFITNLKLVMENRSKGKEPIITANDYNWWRDTQFYQDELIQFRSKVEAKITDTEFESCKFHADEQDNLESVRRMLDDYIQEVEHRQEERKAAKRRFVARVSQPTAARAFLKWKMSIRSKASASTLQSSGMFQEPKLPLNVRHPYSGFSTVAASTAPPV